MNLINLLSITSEYTKVNIVDYFSDEVIGRYNGKDSISSKLNKKEVTKQYVKNNELYIVVM